jgi:hypothetical protein
MREREMTVKSKTAEYKKEYYYANHEKALASAKTYRDKNKDKVRDSLNAWRKKNPEKIRAYGAKYRDEKRIEKEYTDWNDTLRDLGYADLIN